MMVRSNRMKIFFILFFFLGVFVFPQIEIIYKANNEDEDVPSFRFKNAGDSIDQGNMYLSKGKIYSKIGKNSRALKMYNNALQSFKLDFIDLLFSYPISIPGTWNNFSDEKVPVLFEKMKQVYQGKGDVYLSKGEIYSRTGKNSRALKMYDKALLFFKKVGDPIGRGNVYLRKGTIYSRIGKNSRALEMYDKALPIYEEAVDLIGQGNVYQCKGAIYATTGNNSRALELYDKALQFFEKAGQPIGQGNVYRSKGYIYFHTGENSKAFEMYDNALLFYKKAGDPNGLGNVYQGKGSIYVTIGKNSLALEMFDKALSFFKKAGQPIGQGNVYFKKGVVYSIIDEWSMALDMYNRALVFYKKSRDIVSEANALYGKAMVLIKQGRKNKALKLFEKGIANLEKVRTQTAFPGMKRTLMENIYNAYQETILFMLANKYYDKSFKYAELMKARAFLDQMAEGLVRLDKELTPDLKQKRDNLVSKLSLLSKAMHKTDWNKEKKKFRELKDQFRKAGREFEDLLVKIRLNNPLYTSVRYPQPITARALQKDVLKKGETMLRYFISPNKLYVFIISRESFNVVPITVKEKEINGIVKRYLPAVRENNSSGMRRYGRALYKRVFKPLEKTLKGSNDIIIVPDGELAKIPFESFIIDNKKSGRTVFLLEKYRIKYVQSASLLSVLRKHYRRDRGTKNFIGFGDPVYDYESFTQGKPKQGALFRVSKEKDEIKEMFRSRYARAGGIMSRLPRSGEEVKTIARFFEKKLQKCVVYLRRYATEDIARTSNMKDFDYIHFACHGLLNDEFQSLVLSQDIPGTKNDGYFTLNEIMNCDYNAKLVVLSACQTGSGKMERAEGVTGLTRAVMYAGTPAVMASLWKVDDNATKELMVRFYRNLLEKNLDKTEALRQAKLELIKTQKYISPLFWSAFVMYGE